MSAKTAARQRAAFLLCVGALAVGSTRAFIDYGRLARDLAGGTFVERGRIGADEWRSVLNRAGRLEVRRACREAARLGILDRQVSGLSEAWVAVVETADLLPADARVYLNVPSAVVYFYATTLWYPRRVDLGRSGAIIKDDETLRAAFEAIDPGRYAELRDRGYTHLVTVARDRLVVVDLR